MPVTGLDPSLSMSIKLLPTWNRAFADSARVTPVISTLPLTTTLSNFPANVPLRSTANFPASVRLPVVSVPVPARPGDRVPPAAIVVSELVPMPANVLPVPTLTPLAAEMIAPAGKVVVGPSVVAPPAMKVAV